MSVHVFIYAPGPALMTLAWLQPREPQELTAIPEGSFLALFLVPLTSGSSAVGLALQGDQPPLLLSTELSIVLPKPSGMQFSRLGSRRSRFSSGRALELFILMACLSSDKAPWPCTETVGGHPLFLRTTPLLYQLAPKKEEEVLLVFLACFSWVESPPYWKVGPGVTQPLVFLVNLPEGRLWPWKWKEALVLSATVSWN